MLRPAARRKLSRCAPSSSQTSMTPERLKRESTMLAGIVFASNLQSYDFGNHEYPLQNNELSQLETVSHQLVCRKAGNIQTKAIPSSQAPGCSILSVSFAKAWDQDHPHPICAHPLNLRRSSPAFSATPRLRSESSESPLTPLPSPCKLKARKCTSYSSTRLPPATWLCVAVCVCVQASGRC